VALREVFGRLAFRRPVVAIVDDVQWGDSDSADVLADLLAPPSAPPFHLVLATRPEDGPFMQRAGEVLAPEHELPELELSQLTQSDVGALVAGLTGRELDDSDLQKLAAASDGHPLFVEQLADRLTRSDEHERTLSLTGAIREKLDELDGRARELLEYVCLYGAPALPSVLSMALGTREEVERHLTELKASRLVKTLGVSDPRVEPYHDRVRETVDEAVVGDTRQLRHRALADGLIERANEEVERIARHLEGAGEAAAASHYARRAALRAREAMAFEQAAEWFARALELGEWSEKERSILWDAGGESLQLAGRGGEAASSFEQASELAASDLERHIRLRTRAAEAALLAGLVDKGVQLFQEVVERVGLRWPSKPPSAARLFVPTLVRGLWMPRPRVSATTALTPDHLLRLEVCWTAANAMTSIDLPTTLYLGGQLLRLARRGCDPATAVSVGGLVSNMRVRLGDVDGAERELSWAGALVPEGEQPTGSLAYLRAQTSFMAGQFRKSRDGFDDYLAASDTLGEWWGWEGVNARSFLCWSVWGLGEYTRLRELVPEFTKEAVRRGNRRAAVQFRTGVNLSAYLAVGDVHGARESQREAKSVWDLPGYHLQHFWLLQGDVMLALYADDPVAACEVIDSWRERIDRSRVLQLDGVVRVYQAYFEGAAELAAVAKSGWAATPNVSRRSARAHIRTLIRSPQAFGRSTGEMLRGILAAVDGRNAQAVSDLTSAAQRFDEFGQKGMAAATRMRLARVQGDQEAERAATDELAALGATDPVAFSRMLVPALP
jgi:tetratricopeptide (TPR) repeat protein